MAARSARHPSNETERAASKQPERRRAVQTHDLFYQLCVYDPFLVLRSITTTRFNLILLHLLVIQSLGEALRLRQQVIASATIYFRRFYSKYSLKSIDPFLLAPTCLFLATKVEEFGLQSQQRFAATAASLSKLGRAG
jgi:hypothetical protein